MMNRLLVVSVAVVSFAFLLTTFGAEKDKKPIKIDVTKLPPAASKQGVTYATDIKPIFDTSCIKCHGEQKPKGHLRLDSLEGVLKGGEDGKVVLAGNSAESVLIANIGHLGDPDDYMPPPKNKAGIGPLTKDQIGLIRAWVEQGAK
jgi:mono/diheme cytochrome c family protein